MNHDLSNLLEAVERSGTDIAPTYEEYVLLAFALATDFGEGGRQAFHRLCRPSAKYDATHADRLYTAALSSGNRGQVHFASAVWLAQQHGVALTGMQAEPPSAEKVQKCSAVQPFHTHTGARTYNAAEVTDEAEGGEEASDQCPLSENSDPFVPLPQLPQEVDWPAMLATLLILAETPAQRDVLLLGLLDVLGCTLAPYLRTLYAGQWIRPVMQVFVVAPPASGKSVVAWCRYLVEPLHDRIRRQVEQARKLYRKELKQYEQMGRERSQMEEPREPQNRLFLIPGDNSSTGIAQNVIDAGGNGLIVETEADTVTTAIGADYGKWSHMLRRFFDQDRIAYNRRQNQEYREVSHTLVGVLLSGTPAQVPPLIPSSENGLFSRQLFYYMPGLNGWRSQFGEQTDIRALMRQRGVEWLATLDEIARHGCITFSLTAAQQQEFDLLFHTLLQRAIRSCGHEMNSSLARLAVNLLRMAMVVALLRHLERRGMEFDVAPHIPHENVQDGTVGSYVLSIDDADFHAVLSLVEPLYQHATHVLSFLQRAQVSNRNLSDQDRLLASMPPLFTRQQWLEQARAMDIPDNTAASWLLRLLKHGTLQKGSERGTYRMATFFTSSGA